MVEHDGHDGRQGRSFAPLVVPALPDPEQVAEEAKGHEGIRGALVLEEEIDEGLAPSVELDGEEEIGVALGEPGGDEAPGQAGEALPVEGTDEGGREDGLELAPGVLGLGEDGFEERVVGVRSHWPRP